MLVTPRSLHVIQDHSFDHRLRHRRAVQCDGSGRPRGPAAGLVATQGTAVRHVGRHPPFATPDPKTRELSGFDVDMCRAMAKRLGVSVTLVPMSIEARVPEVKMGRVDIAIANLFHTLGR